MLSTGYIIIFFVSFIAALTLTPLVRYLAIRRRILDQPDDRKIHSFPVPLLGGIPVFIGVILASSVGIIWSELALTRTIAGLIISSSIIVGLGIVDDRKGMSPVVKLSGQIMAAGIMVFCGCKVALIPNDAFSILISLFWIVGLTNALNLLDNMDGITGGISLIASCVFFVISVLHHDITPAIISLALAGASLGYLRYNFPPASIFLGDAGSMLIGFLLATLGLMVSNGQSSSIGLAIPLLIMAYPIFDTTLVTVTRIADGRKISMGGKDHSTHRIRTLIDSDRQTTFTVYAMNIILAGGALLLSLYLNVISTLIALTITMVALGCLGWRLSHVPVDVKQGKPSDTPIPPVSGSDEYHADRPDSEITVISEQSG